ncbi:MAG: hypothetical protein Q9160_003506 [Pyrenula sp. 1 TL-2023]
MANSKPAHDPLTTLEAMWRGSITRLGQFFKDYKEYGAQTKTVIRGTSGKYRDALDDLETELLDVKWLLEQDLQSVRSARRDAFKKATAKSTPAKRKLDAVAGKKTLEDKQQNPSKRQKPDNAQDLVASKVQERDFADKIPRKQPENKPTEQPAKSSTTTTDKPLIATGKHDELSDEKVKNVVVSTVAIPPADSSKQQPAPPTKEHKTSAATTAATPAAPAANDPPPEAPMSADTNDIGFESIFGSPPPEGNDTNEFDLNMDLTGDLTADSNQMGPLEGSANMAEDPASLNSLLPGLESYANAPNDDFTMLSTSQNNGTSGNTSQALNVDPPAFELPSLDDTNDFDAFLSSNDFQPSAGSEQKKEDPFDDDALRNLGGIEEFDDNDWFN